MGIREAKCKALVDQGEVPSVTSRFENTGIITVRILSTLQLKSEL